MQNKNALNVILLVVLAAYVLSPADLMPGPVDDIIVVLIYLLTNRAGMTLPDWVSFKR